MKLKILICDDIEQHRNWMKAALVNAPITADESKRIELAEELFDIHEFEIVGKAIKALEKGLKVDLGLVDADFCNLPDAIIQDEGFVISEEKTSSRGFDLLESLKTLLPNTPALLFTGYAASPLDIHQEIMKRGLSYGKDCFFKFMDKGYGIQILTQGMLFPLKKAAENFFNGLTYKNKIELNSILKSVPDDALLNCIPDINGRKIGIRNLLMGWSKVKIAESGDLFLVFDDVKTELEKLVNSKQTDNFKPVGIWTGGERGRKNPKNYNYMVTALADYQNNTKYSEWKDAIDRNAAQLVLEVIENQDTIVKGMFPFYPTIKISNYNCKNEDEGVTIMDSAFRIKFFNSLIIRRFAIGLTAIRDSRKNQFRDDLILITIAGVLGRKTKDSDEENGDERVISGLKQFYNEILGLSVQITTGENNLSQKLDYETPKITNEENNWLKEYLPQIEERLSKKNWQSFIE
jgi:hypothetical protein